MSCSGSLLIVGKEDALCHRICERFFTDSRSIFTLGFESPRYAKSFTWNRSSYISTKTVCREIIRCAGIPSETFIIFGPHYEEIFPNLTTQRIDEIVDSELKSVIHLIQEICRKVLTEGTSVSIYFLHIKSHDPKQHLSRAVGSAIRMYAQVLMESELSPYFMGIELETHDIDGFVDYVIKMVTEHSEKKRNSWLSYPKPGIFFGKH